MRNAGPLAKLQTDAADMTRRAQRWAALMFLLALASYEIYIELVPEQWQPLLLYLALLVGIWAISTYVEHRRIQIIAEDYRGLREMMRVQVAWWSAGIDRMVDRVHLRTIDSDLRCIREQAATIAMWAILRCKDLPTCEINQPAPGPEPAARAYRNWIDEQARYFARESRAQLGAKRLADATFEITFATALVGLGALLVVGHWWADRFAQHLPALQAPMLAALPILSLVVVAGLLWTVTGRWRGDVARAPRLSVLMLVPLAVSLALLGAAAARRGFSWTPLSDWVSSGVLSGGPVAFFIALGTLVCLRVPGRARAFRVRHLAWWQKGIGVALLTATLLTGAIALAPDVQHVAENGSHNPIEPFRALVLIGTVLLLGSSGMIRWYTERRNHLGQARHYDDMLRAFLRAQDWLHTCPHRPDRVTQEGLVVLGELALDENEAWLKAHRERPTEAIAGT